MRAACLSSILLQHIAARQRSPPPSPANMLDWESLEKCWEIQQPFSCVYPKPSPSDQLCKGRAVEPAEPTPCRAALCCSKTGRCSAFSAPQEGHSLTPNPPHYVHLHLLPERCGVCVIGRSTFLKGHQAEVTQSWSLSRVWEEALTGAIRGRAAHAHLWSLHPFPKYSSSAWLFWRF